MAELARSAVWKEDCPKCNLPNFYEEEEDGPDGLSCWGCGHKWLLSFWMDEEEWKMYFNSETIQEVLEDEAIVEVGRKIGR